MRRSRLLFLLCALPLLTAATCLPSPSLAPHPPSPPPHTPYPVPQSQAPAPGAQALVLSASHWTTVPLPAAPLGIAARGGDLWVCGWDGMIAESTDAGRTWHIRHFKKDGQTFFALAFAAPDQVYAFGPARRSLASSDGGRTWRKWPGPGFAVNRAYFAGPSADLLTGPFAFAFGHPAHWKARTPVQASAVTSAALLDSRHAVLLMAPLPTLAGPGAPGTASAPVASLWLTADAGRGWASFRFPPDVAPQAVAAARGHYWLTAANRLLPRSPMLLTSDDGRGWHWVLHVRRTGGNCNAQGCREPSGWRPFALPGSFTQPWSYPIPADPAFVAAWAAVPGVVCDVGGTLRCALSGAARPDGPAPPPAPQASVQPPEATRSPDPGWPHGAQAQGLVLIRIRVGRDGRAHDPVLLAAASRALAQAALQDLAQWRFRPALERGKPLAVSADTRFYFRRF